MGEQASLSHAKVVLPLVAVESLHATRTPRQVGLLQARSWFGRGWLTIARADDAERTLDVVSVEAEMSARCAEGSQVPGARPTVDGFRMHAKHGRDIGQLQDFIVVSPGHRQGQRAFRFWRYGSLLCVTLVSV